MANDTQNIMLQQIMANAMKPDNGASEYQDDGSFSPALDPEVRKRLQLGFKMGQEAKANGQPVQVPPGTPPQASAAANNPFLSKFSVSSNFQSPEDRATQKDMQLQFKDLLAQQQGGLDKQDQAISDMKTNARNDWVVPAAGFLDQTFGGNQTAVAKDWSGMSPEERAKEIAKMEGSQNQQRAAMSNQVKSLLDSNNTMKMAEMADKNNRALMGQDMRLNMAFNKDVQTANKVGFETLQQVTPIEAALAPDANGMVDYARVTQALANASRLMGERGVLTDQDIDRVQRKTIDSQIATLQGWITSNPSQPVPASIVAPLAAAIQDGKRSMQSLMQKRLNGLKDSYVNGYGMRPEVGETVVNQVYGPMFQQGLQPTTPGATMQKQGMPAGVNQAPMPKGSLPGGRMSKSEFEAWKAGR